MAETITLKIEAGALTEAPCYEGHQRGKNWFAKIWTDPKGPSGLGREFASKAHGEFLYLVPEWAKPGTPVEFGGDYYSGSGRPSRDRWYGVIRGVQQTFMLVEKCSTAREAIRVAAGEPEPKKPQDPYGLAHILTETLEAELARRKETSWSGYPLGEPKNGMPVDKETET